MIQRVLINISVPAAHNEMDVYIPVDITLDELCEQVANLVQQASHARFCPTSSTLLFRKSTGECLCGNILVSDIGLKHSEICIIM